jgi:hypothetical protein
MDSAGPVFIVTTYLQTKQQEELFLRCIASIEKFHPGIPIVVLDDTGADVAFPISSIPASCHIEKTQFLKCGEVNAYAWAIQHRHEYSFFIYLHDSTILLKELPLDLSGAILRPMWHSTRYIKSDTQGSHLLPVLEGFDMKDLQTQYWSTLEHLRRGHGGQLVFGGMAMWDRELCEKLEKNSNFLEIAPHFDTRQKRCFFERFLYAAAHTLRPFSAFREISICGDIFNHGQAFNLHAGVNPANACNPYILKVWQGR